MKIIIAGAGEVGTYLAKMLSIENHEIVVIDTDIERLNSLDSHLEVMTLQGSSASIETLKEAGVCKADLFLSVAPTEELNITSGILSKKLGARKTIARIDSPEYLKSANKELIKSMGIDSLIYPEQLAAKEVVGLLNQTGTTEVVDFSSGKLMLVVVRLGENAPIVNHTLLEAAELNSDLNYRAVAITRDGNTIVPRGSDIFKVNDVVYVITSQAGIPKLMRFSGKQNIHIRNIMIVGGSRIGAQIAKVLQHRSNIKLIEIERTRSFKLADELDKTMVIRGDGSEFDLLIEEGIKEMDAFIAVTGNSETNILTCLLAKKLGVKKTIAEVENIEYIGLAENIGIDSIINKKFIAASHIFGFTMNAQISSVKCLTGTDAEVLEISPNEGSRITKAPLSELDFPEEAIVGGVVRGKSGFIASGDTHIRSTDKVIVFTLPSVIAKVEGFFK
ncbi:MAG: Trk system potassium transporter TrkA [Bacteroidales bacterium]|nr:Trk system potassium transporter TrkA [Bacteroidales bacterium]